MFFYIMRLFLLICPLFLSFSLCMSHLIHPITSNQLSSSSPEAVFMRQLLSPFFLSELVPWLHSLSLMFVCMYDRLANTANSSPKKRKTFADRLRSWWWSRRGGRGVWRPFTHDLSRTVIGIFSMTLSVTSGLSPSRSSSLHHLCVCVLQSYSLQDMSDVNDRNQPSCLMWKMRSLTKCLSWERRETESEWKREEKRRENVLHHLQLLRHRQSLSFDFFSRFFVPCNSRQKLENSRICEVETNCKRGGRRSKRSEKNVHFIALNLAEMICRSGNSSLLSTPALCLSLLDWTSFCSLSFISNVRRESGWDSFFSTLSLIIFTFASTNYTLASRLRMCSFTSFVPLSQRYSERSASLHYCFFPFADILFSA